MDPFSGRINPKKTKQLFFNAETDPDTLNAFKGLDKNVHVAPREVRAQEPKVNPFQSIDDRNEELRKVTLDLASRSDSVQQLVRGPSIHAPSASETVELKDLPHMVQQAAENALRARTQKKR